MNRYNRLSAYSSESSKRCGNNSVKSMANRTDCKGPVLAMAYVESQDFDEIYSPSVALKRGTLFAALDKPYCGCRKSR